MIIIMDHILIDTMPLQTTVTPRQKKKQHRVMQHRAYHSSSAKLPSSISDLWLLGEVENS